MDDHSSARHIHFRLWQISVSAITLFVTAWGYTQHLVLGIAFTFLAKHIIVSVLAAGFDAERGRK